MTISSPIRATQRWYGDHADRLIASYWPLLAGAILLIVPTLVTVAQQHWGSEAGAHAPLVLVTGGWLIWRQWPELRAYRRAGSFAKSLAMLFPALLIYTFGRAFDYLSLEALGLYVSLIAITYFVNGSEFLKRIWFPLLYLAFAIPVPGWIIDQVTAPLKTFASAATTEGLAALGLPIVREGVTIFVAQYQLLVEDACAGLNSLVGLTSMGLFYAYVVRGSSWRYSSLLMLFIIPIAVLANVIRIVLLVLLTLWGGNDAAQGFLHGMAGLVMFGSALLLIFAIDSVLSRLILEKPAAA
jgi:exosortase